MDSVPDNIVNPAIYKKAKQKADSVYKRHSAYKSMYIQKTYQDMGGKYKGKKNTKGVTRWNREKWIQVVPFLVEGKKVVCGEGDGAKGCRPSVRVDKDTPITLPELVKKHGKKALVDLAKKKKADMDRRVDWANLTISGKK
tara:strand:- start:104 stop:526 length:423 start_codon:yes stop_codon:yes gene_type:complete